jgi:hypothetical protein
MSDERSPAALQDVGARETEAAVAHPSQTEADLERLRALLEESDVEGARRFVKELAARWPNEERVQHYARVLAPPRTQVIYGKRGRRMDKEFAWLREYGHQYRGQWVALYEDRLVAADPDLQVVRATVQRTPGVRGALIHRIPERGEAC